MYIQNDDQNYNNNYRSNLYKSSSGSSFKSSGSSGGGISGTNINLSSAFSSLKLPTIRFVWWIQIWEYICILGIYKAARAIAIDYSSKVAILDKISRLS